MASRRSIASNIEIVPSQVGPLMKAVWAANRVPYLHGPPGIGKSDLLKQQANAMGIAYIDIRLASKNPSQIAGIPFPIEEHGGNNVRFAIPIEFPRDLDVEAIIEVNHRQRVRFSSLNPRGANNIHYCKNPTITARCLDDTLEARLVETANDYFIVEVFDANGKSSKGDVLYTIVGKCQALMCFDELSSANHAVQAVAYSLVNDRRLGEYIFPDGVKLTAAGNRAQDKGVNFEIAQPLRNRFSHYTLKVRWQDWVAYARLVNAYLPIIEMMVEFEGKMLFEFDPESKSMAWPSPRSWMILSDIEYALDAAGIVDDALRLAAIAGTIGDTYALSYIEFKKRYGTAATANDIISGKVAGRQSPVYDTSTQMFVASSMIHLLSNRLRDVVGSELGDQRKVALKTELGQAFYEQANNAFQFMMDNFQPDVTAGIVRQMSTTYKLPLDPRVMPAMKKFIEQNSRFIL